MEATDFGMELVLDLYECDAEKIADGEYIKSFAVELCEEIEMRRFGEPLVPHFGHDNPVTSGYSLVQLIETSSITAHFSEYKRAVYLNVFSCKRFDPEKTASFCRKWFGAERIQKRVLVRK